MAKNIVLKYVKSENRHIDDYGDFPQTKICQDDILKVRGKESFQINKRYIQN